METQKIVVNTGFGFGISHEAVAWIQENIGITISERYSEISRNDPVLVRVVEVLGDRASVSGYSNLKIVEIPKNVEWEIVRENTRSGSEYVREIGRRWYAQE